MLGRYLTYRLIRFLSAAALLWLGGCVAVGDLPVVKQLSAGEEARLGAAVAPRLLQLLGGPYHDRQLSVDLKRLVPRSGSQQLEPLVADRSEPALYVLPGQRLVLTRGLLARSRSGAELSALLQAAREGSSSGLTRSMAAAFQELETVPADPFDPTAADLRLATAFAERSCTDACLARVLSGQTGISPVPKSVARLAELQPGYDQLARAQQLEASGNGSQAITLMLQTAGETPDEPLLLGALGMAYLRAGQVQQARLHLQKSVKLQPDYYRTQMGLGYLYLQLKRDSEARAALSRSVALLPVTENLFLLGEAHEKTGDASGAANFYRRIVRHDGSSKLGREAQERLDRLERRR